MATLPTHLAIDRPADEAWSVVSDAGTLGPAIGDGLQGLKSYCESRG